MQQQGRTFVREGSRAALLYFLTSHSAAAISPVSPVGAAPAPVALLVGDFPLEDEPLIALLLVRESPAIPKQQGASSSKTDASQVRAGEKSGAILSVFFDWGTIVNRT